MAKLERINRRRVKAGYLLFISLSIQRDASIKSNDYTIVSIRSLIRWPMTVLIEFIGLFVGHLFSNLE